ncbi:MAG: cobyrinate a,c-diamide synthase [Acaryochloridaceae cyanobacterium SU_2_1]|nr:cobyrinate a,c-diamide synthase [Acaryochloridaceae cyanobacterium SU_2_1]
MTLVVAGERSGVGKTTITLALLASLRRQHQTVQSFKVGPDYIDPMFHQAVTGRPCRNLDAILTSEEYIRQSFGRYAPAADYGLVEGVMGLFDGAAGQGGRGSTAHLARLLHLPILLVLDCGRLSDSVAALVHGYQSFDPSLQIAGVVLNRVGSDRHLAMLEAALKPLSVTILGVLRRQAQIAIPDRHLGLVPTDELTELDSLWEQLADLGETCFDWPTLLPLLATTSAAPVHRGQIPIQTAQTAPSLKIAIARDPAFNFYYADNLDLLQELGASLIFWSPLEDATLPAAAQGLYFGGGFPEVFAARLAANESARQSVKQAIEGGLPTYAECGGLMYLCESLQDLAGQTWPMVGVLPTAVKMGGPLTLGYRRAIATQTTPLIPQGTQVWGHEFHHSQLDQPSSSPIYRMEYFSGQGVEGWLRHNLHASYLHLHWGNCPDLPRRFLEQCQSAWAKLN